VILADASTACSAQFPAIWNRFSTGAGKFEKLLGDRQAAVVDLWLARPCGCFVEPLFGVGWSVGSWNYCDFRFFENDCIVVEIKCKLFLNSSVISIIFYSRLSN
jgi:hypothetical protein